MSKLIGSILLALVALSLWSPATAQTGSAKPTSSYERLFLGFAQDATVVDKQWWEGSALFVDGEELNLGLLRGVVAFQPWQDVELGGSVAFGNSDASAGGPDGRGATDLELWGKYYLGGSNQDTEFAVGGWATLPTGDDAAGLGQDAFGLGGFGSLRYRLPSMIVSAHVGLQFNGDGTAPLGFDIEGKTSTRIGGGVIIPFSDQASFVGEFQFNTERFEDGDNDARVLAGVNWRAFNRGVIRAAAGVGLSDGAPDFQLQAGYAVIF